MTNNKEEARLAEKLTKMYNAHCTSNTTMTLATVQTKVKKFWRDKKKQGTLCTTDQISKVATTIHWDRDKITQRKTRVGNKERKIRRNQATKRDSCTSV